MPSEEHYDDSAFTYFALSVLVIILIPTTISYFKVWKEAFSNKYDGKCGCKPCRKKARRLQIESRKPSVWGILKFLLWIGVWALFIYLIVRARSSEVPVTQTAFDPYAMLELDIGASEEEVKKAYRRLSLLYHPDKSDDPDAHNKFIAIAKAHKTLTDDEMREKWEKYGNPDGPQGFSVGIALPSWLVDTKNSFVVLTVYVVFLMIIFPTIAICWWQRQKELAPNQLNLNTMRMFYQYITENMRFKKLIEILSLSCEYTSKIQLRRADEIALQKIKPLIPEVEKANQKKKDKPGKKPKLTVPPHAIKNTMLFYSHLSRLHAEIAKTSVEGDLDILLRQAHPLIGGMVDMTASTKRWLTPVVEAISISQMITQAVWGESSRTGRDTTLLQLPHFTEDMVKKLNSKKWKISSIDQFLNLEETKRREFLLGEGWDESQIQDIESVIRSMPDDVDFVIKAQVDEEDEKLGITAGSVVTLDVVFERPSKPGGKFIDDKSKEDPELIEVHAPFFPMKKNELWWLIVSDGSKIVTMKRIPTLKDKTEIKLPFLAPKKPGNYQYTVGLMSDSFVGFDKRKNLKLNVGKEVSLPNNQLEDESGSESEEEDKDNKKKKKKQSDDEDSGSDKEVIRDEENNSD